MNSKTTLGRLLATGVAAGAIGVGAAGAQTAGAPQPCGPVTADPAGDARVGFAGNYSPVPAGSNEDLTGMFFRNDGKKQTAHFTFVNLSKTIPTGAAGLVYRFIYEVGDQRNFFDTDVAPDGTVTYIYGHFAPTLTVDGDGKGQFIEGKDGQIAIELPATHGGKPGTKLINASVRASRDQGAVIAQSDIAPDTDGVNFNGAECGGSTAPAADPTGTPEPTAGSGGPGGSGGSGSSGAPAGPGTSPQNQTAVVYKAGKVSPKAKQAAKKRKLTVALTSSEEVSNVRAQLKKGKKVIGTGKLQRLAKSGKITLKLKKGFKRGTYTLYVVGTRSNGASAAANLKLKVK